MLILVIRKMLSNCWLVLCLLFGFILVVAMVASIPIYTDGILQRMLTKDLENYQIESGIYPGSYYVRTSFYQAFDDADRPEFIKYSQDKIENEMIKEIPLPIKSSVQVLTVDYLTSIPESKNDKIYQKYITLRSITGLQDHIDIIHGRMYSTDNDDGIYEVIVTEGAMKKLDLVLNEVYILTDMTETIEEKMKVKVVGVFTIKDGDNPYWFQSLNTYGDSFIIDYELFYDKFINSGWQIVTESKHHFAFDYHKITLDNIDKILAAYKLHNNWYNKYRWISDFKMPVIPILETYYEREQQLKTNLWILMVPVLLMLTFYIFMVSQLIVSHEENEIAVMKSRGASRWQIFYGYLIESLILSIITLCIGPPLGLFICTILGASNGFLEFVQRTALPISLNWKAYSYSLITLIFFIITMLVPAYISSQKSIVQYKQIKSIVSNTPVWKKFFLDILMVLLSAYGLYRYKSQQEILSLTGVKGTEIGIEPLLFLMSTFFVLGAGLMFLRIYPYIIRLIFYVGRKVWSPVLYASFIQVGRSGGREQFLMIFIILSISIGIFNANAARTLNRNMEDKIYYDIGADIEIMPLWETVREEPVSNYPGSDEAVKYIEPPFELFSELSGVEVATKVFINDNARVQYQENWLRNVRIMGIVPHEFGKTAWFRNDLLSHHWYEYLNLMSGAPKALLVSTSFKDKYNAQVGDSLYLTWGDQGYLEGTIYAFVDYWPAFNPNPQSPGEDPPVLVVANLDYIHKKMAIEPYRIWIKKKSDATDTQVNQDIADKKIKIIDIKYSNQQVIIKKNDPLLQGINGALTLGFVVTMLIATIGFLIYWIMSIQKRVLQFGVFRAMGLSLKKVIGMIACEQVLISGIAILIGIICGGVASTLFVPLLQLVHSAAEQVPPFKIIADVRDYEKIYIVVTLMLLTGFLILGRFISRIKIEQAVKLGED